HRNSISLNNPINLTTYETVLNTSHLSHTKVIYELSIADVTEMNSNFGFNFYRKMADKHDDNIFFSPFSVSYSLASLMLGTQGITHGQLLEGLNLNKFKHQKKPYLLPTLFKKARENITNNEGFILDIGTFAFMHETFTIKEEFLNNTSEYFDMEYQAVNFHSSEAKNIINDYVNKKSRGKINQLYDSLEPQTKFVLLNYILFKGKWLYPFNPQLTEMDTFYIDKYNSVKVPMMYKTDVVHFVLDKTLSCTVLKIPYRGGAYMLIAMPGKDGDLAILEDKLSTELIDNWLAKMNSRKIDIFLPKFKLDQQYSLKASLEKLGIQELFTGKANLTGLTEERDLKLSEVKQRAVFEVDEKGSEASAVTGSEITAYTLTSVIRVNSPFLFMIREETYKSLLFIGRVVDPTKL
uniref:Serpin family A member 10 n=1 Tax=Leptobrachium leishanense TaxID=445787 RepID=A0A8C5R2P7_9ANUR